MPGSSSGLLLPSAVPRDLPVRAIPAHPVALEKLGWGGWCDTAGTRGNSLGCLGTCSSLGSIQCLAPHASVASCQLELQSQPNPVPSCCCLS